MKINVYSPVMRILQLVKHGLVNVTLLQILISLIYAYSVFICFFLNYRQIETYLFFSFIRPSRLKKKTFAPVSLKYVVDADCFALAIKYI